MKRKIGIGIICLLAVIIVAGAVGYQYLFNNLDEETKGKIDEEIGTIAGQVQENIQAGKEQIPLDDEEVEQQDQKNDQDQATVPEVPSGTVKPQKPSGETLSGEAANVVTEGTEALTKRTAALVELYYGGLKELETKGNAIVDQLLSNAKEDYKRVTESGGGKSELVSLASAYSNQASAMESGMDASVEGLLVELKKDLVEEGVSASEADTIISQLRNEYKTKKKARYDQVYAKFQEVLNLN